MWAERKSGDRYDRIKTKEEGGGVSGDGEGRNFGEEGRI